MSFPVKGCLAPFRALRSHCVGAPRRAEPPLDAAAKKALESVLLTVVNASVAGVTPSSRAQKLHDRLQREQLQESPQPMSRRKLATSLERLQGEYEATRAELRASALRWSKDWLMGVECCDGAEITGVYARVEAATDVIRSAGVARAELRTARARPVSW